MLSRIILGASLILAHAAANSTTVVTTLDFDSAMGTLSSYVEDGYMFDDLSTTGGLVSFSDGKLRLTGPDPIDAFVRLKRIDGGLFNLVSFEVQEINDGPRLLVSGGGGSAQLTGTFEPFPFVPPMGTFVDMDIITFRADGIGLGAIAEYTLDNIILSAEVATVPLPPALPLMALALAGIGFSRNRKSVTLFKRR